MMREIKKKPPISHEIQFKQAWTIKWERNRGANRQDLLWKLLPDDNT